MHLSILASSSEAVSTTSERKKSEGLRDNEAISVPVKVHALLKSLKQS